MGAMERLANPSDTLPLSERRVGERLRVPLQEPFRPSKPACLSLELRAAATRPRHLSIILTLDEERVFDIALLTLLSKNTQCHEQIVWAFSAATGPHGLAQAFKPARELLVGGEGIPIEEFLLKPVAHWATIAIALEFGSIRLDATQHENAPFSVSKSPSAISARARSRSRLSRFRCLPPASGGLCTNPWGRTRSR
jgi:hypothetical protein